MQSSFPLYDNSYLNESEIILTPLQRRTSMMDSLKQKTIHRGKSQLIDDEEYCQPKANPQNSSGHHTAYTKRSPENEHIYNNDSTHNVSNLTSHYYLSDFSEVKQNYNTKPIQDKVRRMSNPSPSYDFSHICPHNQSPQVHQEQFRTNHQDYQQQQQTPQCSREGYYQPSQVFKTTHYETGERYITAHIDDNIEDYDPFLDLIEFDEKPSTQERTGKVISSAGQTVTKSINHADTLVKEQYYSKISKKGYEQQNDRDVVFDYCEYNGHNFQ